MPTASNTAKTLSHKNSSFSPLSSSLARTRAVVLPSSSVNISPTGILLNFLHSPHQILSLTAVCKVISCPDALKRAGITFELLKTTTSTKSRICASDKLFPFTTSIRDASRAANGCDAINSAGSSKSKSDVCNIVIS